MRMEAKVDALEKDLEFVKSILDGVDAKLENVNSRMENLEGNVETVKDYFKELPGSDWGKAPMEQPPLSAQLSPMRKTTPPLPARQNEQMRYGVCNWRRHQGTESDDRWNELTRCTLSTIQVTSVLQIRFLEVDFLGKEIFHDEPYDWHWEVDIDSNIYEGSGLELVTIAEGQGFV